MRAIILAVLTLAAPAWADGVALFKPGAPLAPAQAASVAQFARTVKSMSPIVIDPAAIETTVINVPLGGTTYRFVGVKRELPQSTRTGPFDPSNPAKQTVIYEPGGSWWEGTTPQGDRAYIGKSQYGVSGQFFAGGKQFLIIRSGGQPVLVEIDPTLAPRAPSMHEPTQAMIDAARKKPIGPPGASK